MAGLFLCLFFAFPFGQVAGTRQRQRQAGGGGGAVAGQGAPTGTRGGVAPPTGSLRGTRPRVDALPRARPPPRFMEGSSLTPTAFCGRFEPAPHRLLWKDRAHPPTVRKTPERGRPLAPLWTKTCPGLTPPMDQVRSKMSGPPSLAQPRGWWLARVRAKAPWPPSAPLRGGLFIARRPSRRRPSRLRRSAR